MKLFEIVNLKQVDKIDVPAKKQYYGDESAYAQVFKDTDDDHLVKKLTTPSDPYHLYLKWISEVEHRMASNPYLPRVYEQSKDAHGNTLLRMEKLFEFDTLNSKELDVFSKRVLGQPSSTVAKNYVENTSLLSRRMRQEYLKYHHRPVALAISDVVEGGEFADIHDPLMKDALQAIGKLAKQSGRYLDLHSGNFMIRRGPTGAQVVIIDPLS